jgi:hypothetical protein
MSLGVSKRGSTALAALEKINSAKSKVRFIKTLLNVKRIRLA